MVNISLQFSAFKSSNQVLYKPTSRLAQLFCLLKNIDYFDQNGIDRLQAEGYLVILDDEGLEDYQVKVEN